MRKMSQMVKTVTKGFFSFQSAVFDFAFLIFSFIFSRTVCFLPYLFEKVRVSMLSGGEVHCARWSKLFLSEFIISLILQGQ